MTFPTLTKESQDIGNSLRLQMAQLHTGLAKSTRAATAKIGLTVHPTGTTVSSISWISIAILEKYCSSRMGIESRIRISQSTPMIFRQQIRLIERNTRNELC